MIYTVEEAILIVLFSIAAASAAAAMFNTASTTTIPIIDGPLTLARTLDALYRDAAGSPMCTQVSIPVPVDGIAELESYSDGRVVYTIWAPMQVYTEERSNIISSILKEKLSGSEAFAEPVLDVADFPRVAPHSTSASGNYFALSITFYYKMKVYFLNGGTRLTLMPGNSTVLICVARNG